MAKLRKMLGRADDPQIVTLMHLIETQSKPTLAAWAAACVQERYLPVYERAYPHDRRLRELIEAVDDHLRGALKLPQLKILLRQARAVPQEAEGDPAAQAHVLPEESVGRRFRLWDPHPADYRARPGQLARLFNRARRPNTFQDGVGAGLGQFLDLGDGRVPTFADDVGSAKFPGQGRPIGVVA